MIRFSLYKLLMLLLLCIGFYVFAHWQIALHNRMRLPPFSHTCNMSEAYRANLENLFERVHQLLDRQGLTHILCYGTLWGQIRMAKMLPWRKQGEFCVFNEELMRHDEAKMLRDFFNHDLHIRYVHSEGLYRIFDGDQHQQGPGAPFVELVVFQRDDEQAMYKRIGWKRRLMPPHCDWTPSLDCFPVTLLKQSLPRRQLGRHFYTVPMGGIELQKYHYAHNWWKDVKIFNCNLP